MARIIVAEDDHKQAELLRSYLERDGHSVVLTYDGHSALAELRARRPDLVLLDVMLPGMNGFEICQAIRAERLATAVIMVTARVGEDDQISGLDYGADDYVTKPYSLRQLMARVRAVLRRAGADDEQPPTTIDGLHIDHERCQVRVDGVSIELTPREMSILEALAAKPGRAFTRGQLLAEAAGFDHSALERTVDMHVVNLRRKIEPNPAEPRYVLTVKGRGYKLAEGTR